MQEIPSHVSNYMELNDRSQRIVTSVYNAPLLALKKYKVNVDDVVEQKWKSEKSKGWFGKLLLPTGYSKKDTSF